jgi:hypothetical protein
MWWILLQAQIGSIGGIIIKYHEIEFDVQDEAVDHKNRNLQDSIEIPKLENNNLMNLGAQDEEAESHKTGRKNKITKSNWNSGAEMTLVVNQCARWRSRAPNRNYKIP